MNRLAIALLSLATTAVAQDHIFPLGFASSEGPFAQPPAVVESYPAARVKDANFDGQIDITSELHTFLSTCFNSTGGLCFMTDARAVVVDGELEIYMTDSREARVIRCVDRNHNGVIDRGEDVNGNGRLDAGEDTNGNGRLDTEVSEFFYFGTNATQNLLAPDTLAVYRDPVANQTRVYVALDNGTASDTGFTHGIYRLVDLNGDGDAKDVGEESLFVSSTMGLTVPGTGGPVAIDLDFWSQLRMLPGGKLIAYAQGRQVDLTVTPQLPLQPAMNAFYGFTDNNGTAVPEVWFNCSQLNSLPRHPDWQNGTYPNWDVNYGTGSRNFARWLAVAPHGFAGVQPVYYLASSYSVVTPPNTASNPGDLNVNGQHVAGLIYRIVDANNNQVIDAGELTLWANLSGTTYAGVAPIGFTNQNAVFISSLTDRTWSVDAADDGEFSFVYNNGGAGGTVQLRDVNFDGTIDGTEIAMTYATTSNPPPYNPTFGPFFTYSAALRDGLLPGPMPIGVQTSGEGCFMPSSGMRAVMDAWGGAPQVGNLAFKIGPIRNIPFGLSLLILGTGLLPVPVPLSLVGFPAGCTLDVDNLQIWGVQFADVQGRTPFALPIPNAAFLIGAVVPFQSAMFDPASPVALPWHTSNALVLTIQP